MHDQLVTGRRFRVLSIVDDVTRECLRALADTSISGRRVMRELADLITERGRPKMIVSNNRTKLTSNAVGHVRLHLRPCRRSLRKPSHTGTRRKLPMPNRKDIADMIIARMTSEQARMTSQYAASRGGIGYFYIDNLLPEELALAIHAQFPKPETMKLKKTLREYKYIAAQMNHYDPILEESVYAFQDERVVELVKNICDMKSAYPDVHLYAGGISMMGKDQYLNPHLDNSHDKDRDRWRVLNLLYYVTPDWKEENGGNLEVWPGGVENEQTTIHSRFNRLVVMATHNQSWHSVSPIKVDGFRCCVSNYYFADEALKPDDTFHVTSFRGRPEQKIRDVVLRADATARMAVRKVFAKGVVENEHLYKREQDR